MPAGKSAGKNTSARSVASLSGTTEATVRVPRVVILLVLAQATDGSSILSPGAALSQALARIDELEKKLATSSASDV